MNSDVDVVDDLLIVDVGIVASISPILFYHPFRFWQNQIMSDFSD